MTMTTMTAHRQDEKRSPRKSAVVKRKTTKRKRVGKEIESIIRLIMIVKNHLKMKVIENEETTNIEVMKTPPMMDHMMMKIGGETNVSGRENIMIQIAVLQTLQEVMIERKARRRRNTNQSPQNDYDFIYFK
jgi:hypothetical protein